MRFTLDVGPADVGARVVLRRRLAAGGFADVLGHVERWADGVVVVRTRSGALVDVPVGDLVAAKRVPPPPAARRR